jgi:hypothetical protein
MGWNFSVIALSLLANISTFYVRLLLFIGFLGEVLLIISCFQLCGVCLYLLSSVPKFDRIVSQPFLKGSLSPLSTRYVQFVSPRVATIFSLA